MNPQQSLSPARPAPRSSARSAPGLQDVDPRIAGLMEAERHRQQEKLILIASESMCPAPVREVLTSEFSNLYAEGYPSTRMAVWERELLDWDARHVSFYQRYGDRRYYKGCEIVNLVEAEAIRRVCELFATDDHPAERIFANVQPLSGAAANNAVYEALVPRGGKVMGMHLSCGGHLTHGSPVNRSGRHYQVAAYQVPLEDGRLDMAAIAALARAERPDMIIAGYSAYPWTIDWAAFRAIADEVGAKLLADIAHPAGLVAAREFPSPVGHAHAVSFTTHKTLCGPRGACILTTDPELARKIDFAVFPGEQGGPHIQAIAAKATAFRLANTEEFRALQRRVKENAVALAEGLSEAGFVLAYGGTCTHLCLVDLNRFLTRSGEPIAADIASRVLDLVGITCNKNSIAGDTRALNPSGLRFGTTWAAQRGLGPEDMRTLAALIGDVLREARSFTIQAAAGSLGRVRLPASVLRDARQRLSRLLEQDPARTEVGVWSYPSYEPMGPSGSARPRLAAFGDAGEERPFGGGRVPVTYGSATDEAKALQAPAFLVDTSHAPVLWVRGERSDVCLQQVFAGDVLGLEPGRHLGTRAYTPEGMRLGEFRVACLPADERGFAQYLVTGDADQTLDLLSWLRELSDGMVSFDEDVTRKVDGPVVVEDLGADGRIAGFAVREGGVRVLLTVAGTEGAAALARAGLSVPGGAGQVQVGEDPTAPVVLAHSLAEGGAIHEVVLPLEQAEALVGQLRATLPVVGERAWLAERRRRGAPPAGETGQETGEVARSKPYFIGQSAVVPDFSDAGDRVAWEAPPAPEGELRRTPMHAWHQAHTKKWNLVPFAGWEMPVMYEGILEEHRAVREAAGLFDVAHMGVLEVTGRHAARFLDLVTTNYVTRMRAGDGQYSYTLSPDGVVQDDLLVYRREASRFLVVVNAANAEKVLHLWQGVAEDRWILDPARPSVRFDGQVRVRDLKGAEAGDEARVDLALQGPCSLEVLQELCADDRERAALRELARFQLCEVTLAGRSVLVARTGYTGEAVGFELYVHPGHALHLWETILEVGEARGVRPAGLGARDSTRTEAGFPLYGNELAGVHGIAPQGAGYASFVKWHKPFFLGREALLRAEQERTFRVFRALVTDPAARPVRTGDTVVDGKGHFLGRVTSAAFAGADQILLFHGREQVVRKGSRIGVFPLPRNHKPLGPEPAKDVLGPGDSVLLPITAEVLPRFLNEREKKARAYGKR